MNYATARDVAEICAAELVPSLKHLRKGTRMPHVFRVLVEEVRDKLDKCLALIGDDAQDDVLEDWYQPLADARSFVADALYRPQFAGTDLDTAYAILSDVKDKARRQYAAN